MNIAQTAKYIKDNEGFRDKPYRDTVGKLTIGYGRNLEDRGISYQEAAILLHNDMSEAISLLKTEPYWNKLSTSRRQALVDMVYNMGWNTFCSFKRMREALKLGNYQTAADELMNSKYAKQVPNRAKRNNKLMRQD